MKMQLKTFSIQSKALLRKLFLNQNEKPDPFLDLASELS
jgi:hypothetical protein